MYLTECMRFIKQNGTTANTSPTNTDPAHFHGNEPSNHRKVYPPDHCFKSI